MLLNCLKIINSPKNNTDTFAKNSLKVINYPLTRDKKINTFSKLFQYQKIDIKSPKDSVNITPQNTTMNSNNGSNLIISSKKKPSFKSQINFFPKNIFQIKKVKEEQKKKENEKEKLKNETAVKFRNKANIDYRKGKLINIINFSKLSNMYNSFDNLKDNKTNSFHKSLTNKNNNKMIKFNYLDQYFNKRYENMQQIKQYKPNLTNFLINGTLKNYYEKSEKMNNCNNDLNKLYKDSSILNNIIDYIGAKLYKFKKDKNKREKQELTKMNEEKLFKKVLKLKLKRGELSQDRIFVQKKYMTDDYKINKRIRAKIIYKNGYSSNSFKAVLNNIKNQQILNMKNNNNN